MPENIVEQQDAVDMDSLSLDQIRDLAVKEANAATTTEAKVEPKDEKQQRDLQGRFTATDQDVDQQVDDAPTTTIYKREIDLGDGAGVQVFQATTVEDLLDQLTEAQRNATRKIREQATKLREIEESKKQEEKQFDADKEFVYSQEMLTSPTKAMKSMFKDVTGYDISEFKTVTERVKAWEASQTQQAEQQRMQQEQTTASSQFMSEHPEYLANEKNGKRLVREVNAMAAEARAEGKKINYSDLLTKAFSSLNEDGLLELKAEENVTTVKDTTGAERARIAASEEVVQTQRRKASGLTARGRAAAPPQNTQLSDDELYSMPLDKLRELADRSS